jgi:predicted nucleotidyltransferase
LLQRLSDAEIDFVIVGGFAAILHGSSLTTRDLDVCALLTQENVSKLREIFRDLHPIHRLSAQKISFLDNPAPEVKLNSLYLGTDLGPVDFLSNVLGVGDFGRVRENAVEVELFGRRCRVISLDDLIRAKEALTRDKDYQTVVQLRAIRQKLAAASISPASE